MTLVVAVFLPLSDLFPPFFIVWPRPDSFHFLQWVFVLKPPADVHPEEHTMFTGCHEVVSLALKRMKLWASYDFKF